MLSRSSFTFSNERNPKEKPVLVSNVRGISFWILLYEVSNKRIDGDIFLVCHHDCLNVVLDLSDSPLKAQPRLGLQKSVSATNKMQIFFPSHNSDYIIMFLVPQYTEPFVFRSISIKMK